MPRKFYVDTSVWRDFFEDRRDGLRPLGELAFRFLRNCAEAGNKLLVSDAVLEELRIRFSEREIEELFSGFRESIKEVKVSQEDVLEAKKELAMLDAIIPFKDVLHAVIARREKAIVVTRDRHFFEELSSIAEAILPEDFM